MAGNSASGSAPAKAAEILREVFAPLEEGFTIRLWDGSEVSLGKRVHPFTVAVSSLRAFKRVLLNPTADQFAEAYCDGALEFEGDLFVSMHLADGMERLEIPLWRRLWFALRIWSLSE